MGCGSAPAFAQAAMDLILQGKAIDARGVTLGQASDRPQVKYRSKR